MRNIDKYEYACIFEDDWTIKHKRGIGFLSSGELKPTEELCSLKEGDLVVITTKGATREHLVTWVRESVSGEQWYVWVRPII